MAERPQHKHQELFVRNPRNPLLGAADWPYQINSVFNPGAVRLPSGETLLLCRVEDRTGLSHLCTARSTDGISDWLVDTVPCLKPEDDYPEEIWGVEDPRITRLDELGKYAVAYTSYGPHGPGVSLALTEDFRSFERLGQVLLPDNKDAALLPGRIDGRWAMVHRAATGTHARHIWISYSPDLRHWGDHRLLLKSRSGGWWDADKIGLSTPLIETKQGWLLIYHGVRQTVSGCIYRIGLALLDLDDPSTCLSRGGSWIMGPDAEYERAGDVENVAFPCGYTLGDGGDALHVYYGAADTSIGRATASISELLSWLKTNGESADHSTH